MDFVYICRDGKNEELKYSLRTVFANAPVNNVWVVGGKPVWYIGNHISVLQNGQKHENAQKNLRTILENQQIPDKFILMNDDFFIIDKINTIPVYRGGSLEEKAEYYQGFRGSAGHGAILRETSDMLKENGVRHPIDYSLHIPMTIHKQNLDFTLSLGGATRSVYGNMNRIGGRKLPEKDVKVYGNPDLFPESYDYLNNKFSLPFLSTSDTSFPDVHKNLLKEYNIRSPLEYKNSDTILL